MKEKAYLHDYLMSNKLVLTILLFFVFLSVGINLALPKIVQRYIDSLYGEYSTSLLITLALTYMAIIIVRILLEVLNNYLGEKIGWKAANNLRARLLNHSMKLDMEYYKIHSNGELIERIDGDVNFLANFYSLFVVNFLGNVVLMIGVLILFALENLWLGILYLFLSVIIMTVFSLFKTRISTLWSKAREAETKLYGFIGEHVNGICDIKGIGEENYTSHQFEEQLHNVKKTVVKASFIGNIPATIFYSLLNLGEGLGLALGVYLYLNSDMELGTIYVISSYVALLEIPCMALRQEFMNLQKISVSLTRVNEFLNIPSKVKYGKNMLSSKNPVEIKVKGLTFAYDKFDILHNISFDIENGDIVGIVGKTGSGKSTLLQLLSKMYPDSKDSIFYNDLNINEISESSFHEAVYMVPQKNRLFHASVKENISLFSENISDEDVWGAIENCGLTDWLNRFPDKLNAVLTPDSLSAGEAQLLALARTFVVNPKLFLFDEITSVVDPVIEAKIMQSLKKVVQGKTVIMIAHKLKTLDFANKVLIMKDGEIVLYAPRQEIPNSLIEEHLSQ